MRILIAHNAYQQRGGEDVVAEAEADMLRNNGHEVFEYRRHNDELKEMSKAQAMAEALWSRRTVAEVTALIGRTKPDVLHVHNTFPLISPSIYWAAEDAGIPVVQTLHNFRLLCPQAMFLRDGRVCEDCLGRTPWPGVLHGCYRDSRPQTSAVVALVTLHRGIGTWKYKISRYIALNEFCRRKFIEGGLPANKVLVKPNFVDYPPPADAKRDGFLFVGRLSQEKGISVLAKGVARAGGLRVRVAGAGPLENELACVPGIELLGALDSSQVQKVMGQASALILPSICYENFPRTLVEAFASGLPVIASRLGALAELVEDGVTGLLFSPGDAAELANKMQWASRNPDSLAEMGRQARVRYEADYTSIRNHLLLMAIYGAASGR